ARLGNAEEAENFQRRFEECQGVQKQYSNLLSTEEHPNNEEIIAFSPTTRELNPTQRLDELKGLINVSDMAKPAQYQAVIDKAFPVILDMMSVVDQYKKAA
ncbi:MAG: hypothetical protein D3922_15190, partial [Candidatus Electrothrix sp. AR1]|nr:hypothetical protein [Candidatus Electrothrix sp. AR1]